MVAKSIATPEVGSRVWTVEGFRQHGPESGPKTDVPPNTGGTIAGIEKPHYSMDCFLYVVKWDTSQQTKHYSRELFTVGPFQTLQEFEQAVSIGENAKLIIGPQGGFREFSMHLQYLGASLFLHLHQEQAKMWTWLKSVTEKVSLQIDVEKLAPKPRTPRRKKSSIEALLGLPKKKRRKPKR